MFKAAFSPEKNRAALESYRKRKNFRAAAAALGVSKSTLHRWSTCSWASVVVIEEENARAPRKRKFPGLVQHLSPAAVRRAICFHCPRARHLQDVPRLQTADADEHQHQEHHRFVVQTRLANAGGGTVMWRRVSTSWTVQFHRRKRASP